MFVKKTIIMSSVDGTTKKAVCNIEKTNSGFKGEIRLYNFVNEPEGILSLGILMGKDVVKAGLIKKSKSLFAFNNESNININDFSCALIQLSNGNSSAILFGSSRNEKISALEMKLANSIAILDNNLDVNKIKCTLDENEIFLEDEQEIEEIITESLDTYEKCEQRCGNCQYRQAFFDTNEIKAKKETVKQDDFIDNIKEQLESLFEKYPEEEVLSNIIPNSKWAKIDYENNDEYYVVGVIKDGDIIKYVCYGVPGVYSEEPPSELIGFSKWLSIDPNNEKGAGYWLCYQDAQSGESIEINII